MCPSGLNVSATDLKAARWRTSVSASPVGSCCARRSQKAWHSGC